MKSTPWVEVISGGMFSGKSETLIHRLRRARYARRKVIAFKPVIDDRYSENEIASHSKITFEAIPVSHANEILERAEGFDVVGIDEAQFFGDDIIAVVDALSRAGKQVFIAGLDQDFKGAPFGPMPILLAIADEVTKNHAVCVVCGQKASRSQRIVNSEDTLLVGGASAYEARCRGCWNPEPVFARLERAGDDG